MNYYALQQILSHICPSCRAWVLEAPETWDPVEIEEILTEHFEACYWSTYRVN